MLTLGSLFDGIGGFPLAGAHNGIIPVWASEIEAFPIEVTKMRFPDMVHVGDITMLDGARLPPVDAICGGSPCQDLSVAGQRRGLAGERSGLFMEQVRIVKEMRDADEQRNVPAHLIRPRYLVWENVPGAFSSADGEDFRAVLEEIVRIKDGACHVPRPDTGRWESAGGIILGNQFSLAWRVLDAQYWGVAQRRRRIFLVADFGGLTAPEILFKQDCLFRNPSQGQDAGQGAAAPAPGGTSGAGGDSLTPWDVQSRRIYEETGIWPALYGGEGGGHGYIKTEEKNAEGQAGQGYPCVFTAEFCSNASADARGIGYQGECAPTLKTGTAPSVLCLNDQGGSVMACSEDVSGTLRAQEHGHQPLVFDNHGQDVRFCGPVEASQTISAGFEMGGNNQPLVVAAGQDDAEPNENGQPDQPDKQKQMIGKPVAYSLDSKESNSLKSTNPYSGCRETGTIDTTNPDPSKNQGGIAIRQESICIAGNIIDRKPENGGNGFGYQADISYTLTGMDRHAVFSRQRVDVFRPDEVASTESARQYKDATDLVMETAGLDCRNGTENGDLCGTLQGGSAGSSLNAVHPVRTGQLIRRLTPLECERLQGFPDQWTDIPGASDSARYKALGNSVAIPCVDFVLRGIAYFLRKNKEE